MLTQKKPIFFVAIFALIALLLVAASYIWQDTLPHPFSYNKLKASQASTSHNHDHHGHDHDDHGHSHPPVTPPVIPPGPEVFAGEDITTPFYSFWAEFEVGKKIPEDELFLFFNRIGATLEHSLSAQQQLSELYRTLPEARYILTEILQGYTPNGIQLLNVEADYILESGNIEQFPAMFNFYHQFGLGDYNADESGVTGYPDSNLKVLEVAIDHSITNQNDDNNVIDALYFIGKSAENPELPELYRSSSYSTLESIAQSTQSEQVRTIAIQNMFFSTAPEKSAAIASEYLELYPTSKSLFIETLYAIEGGDIAMTDQLKQKISETTTEYTLTEEEQVLISRVIDPLSENKG